VGLSGGVPYLGLLPHLLSVSQHSGSVFAAQAPGSLIPSTLGHSLLYLLIELRSPAQCFMDVRWQVSRVLHSGPGQLLAFGVVYIANVVERPRLSDLQAAPRCGACLCSTPQSPPEVYMCTGGGLISWPTGLAVPGPLIGATPLWPSLPPPPVGTIEMARPLLCPLMTKGKSSSSGAHARALSICGHLYLPTPGKEGCLSHMALEGGWPKAAKEGPAAPLATGLLSWMPDFSRAPPTFVSQGP
jgi:hypothetical protein